MKISDGFKFAAGVFLFHMFTLLVFTVGMLIVYNAYLAGY